MMITPDPFGPAPEAPDSANICLDIHNNIKVSQSTRSVETQTAPQNRKSKQRWIDLLHGEREASAFSSSPQGKSCRCYVPQW